MPHRCKAGRIWHSIPAETEGQSAAAAARHVPVWLGPEELGKPFLHCLILKCQVNVQLHLCSLLVQMFITCQLKAISQMWRSNSINKACNYVNSRYFSLVFFFLQCVKSSTECLEKKFSSLFRWENVDGYDNVCQRCESICSKKPPVLKSTTHPRGVAAKGMPRRPVES